MTYDFDDVIDFSKSHLLKWEYPSPYLPSNTDEAPLPLWIADMDFQCPIEVRNALHNSINQGVFGYSKASDSLFEAIMQWQLQHHRWPVKEEWIIQSPGVVNSLSLIIQTFTQLGDEILIQPPIYSPFYQCALLNGRRIVTAPLVEKELGYTLDLDVFEAAITPNTKLFFLCNPHNPTGYVWSKDELTAMGDICLRHGIMIISDEIHQDLILSTDKNYLPFANICDEFSDTCITCTSPSKTFNMAGLQTSNLFIANKKIRKKLKHTYTCCSLHIPNRLGLVACEAAYRYGASWLAELLRYLRDNRMLLQQCLGQLSKVRLFDADALYLGWMDFRNSGIAPENLQHELLNRAHLWLDDGIKFGADYAGFARINFACSRSTIDTAIQRLNRLFE
ncbi:MalY/PatB family protein [Xenorhabdus bovienii]|uniref:MalY/PatB family protein n=1 Tax=Xenorhabdus bovienii TaxID=40576 RepID=UPI0004D34BBB|nr:MalY/PatB family protein [Xenorhabdus bovienii]MDE1491741.1 pyridoxal phosphate-dependent aminotransferase [Xenorhabdus bovienii]CDG88286.1 Cystathionine beta-lyase PatB [Xenorhabdus bovienii str. feltiae France]CDG92370.1 Cystathionine beta-lyase PatB [Xenorhabdus bovienii str. feltiae Florida]